MAPSNLTITGIEALRPPPLLAFAIGPRPFGAVGIEFRPPLAGEVVLRVSEMTVAGTATQSALQIALKGYF